MKIINNIFSTDYVFEKSYVAIGTFDGVHIGHKALINATIESAKQHGGKSVVFTFLTHPREATGANHVKLITSQQEKLYFFEELGVDIVIMQPFTKELGELSGEEFTKNVLNDILHTKEIFVGFNFGFGKGRSCGIKELTEYSEKLNIKLRVIEPIKIDGHIVSSTTIRNHLQQGDIALVNSYLGNPYLIIGEVVHGQKIGRQLGFPTANLDFVDKAQLPYGIYGGVIKIEGDDKDYDVVVNIGKNPTLKPGQKSIEIHILDYDKDIYGKIIYLQIIKRIRSEIKFDGIDSLKAQIAKDVEHWRNYLKNIEVGVDYGDNS